MQSFNNAEFWKNIFRPEHKAVNDKLYELLLSDFSYKKEKIVSEYQGETLEYETETLTINIPVTEDYQLSIDFDVEGKYFCEHQLSLIYNNKAYLLGVRDSFHCDDTVFSIEEFYKLMAVIKNNNSENYPYYFLLLSIYVILNNELQGKQLINDVVKLYYQIFPQKQDCNIQIEKIYAEIFKRKLIQDKNSIIRFMINEFYVPSSSHTPTLIKEYNSNDDDTEEVSLFLTHLWDNFIQSL